MRYSTLVTLVTLFACLSLNAYSAQTTCVNVYFNNIAPDIINANMAKQTQELCNTAYAVMYSGITRTPLWSADHLTKQHMYEAKEMKRNDAFHPDERLSSFDRSELADYARSGYDRGHVVPSADAYDEQTQYETFALSNMMPQNSVNNRGLWAGQESAARMLAKSRGEVYVVSGPLFIGDKLKQLNGRVMVPTHLFKAIYDPTTNQAAAYVDSNDESQDYKVMSIDELVKFSGVDPFPFLKGDARIKAMDLPKPVAPNFKDDGHASNTHENRTEPSEIKFGLHELVKEIKHLLGH